jgi:hypothetical protein
MGSGDEMVPEVRGLDIVHITKMLITADIFRKPVMC